jgi:ribosome silencing factor RsfS/YbeB/iojap
MINNKTHQIIEILEDIKVTDIEVYNFQGSFAEYAIIGTASSERHIPAVMERLKSSLPKMIQGKWNRRDDSSWLCLHVDGIIIHIVSQHVREVYQLDRLYTD